LKRLVQRICVSFGVSDILSINLKDIILLIKLLICDLKILNSN